MGVGSAAVGCGFEASLSSPGLFMYNCTSFTVCMVPFLSTFVSLIRMPNVCWILGDQTRAMETTPPPGVAELDISEHTLSVCETEKRQNLQKSKNKAIKRALPLRKNRNQAA